MEIGYSFRTCRVNIIATLFMLALITGIFAGITEAQVPGTLNYQGILTGTDTKPVPDGSYQLTFKLYDTATGSTALWNETQSVTTTKGIFSAILGKVAPLTNIPFDKPYWLGITVNGGTEMSPRVELTASAYSLRARTVADSSVSGMGIASGQVIRNVNGMTDSVSIEAGSNVSIQKSAHKLTISSTGGGTSPWTVSNNNVSYTGGNVGIGTTSPGAILDVSGLSQLTVPQLWLRDTGSNNYSRINLSNASGSNFWAVAGYNNTDQTKERLNFYDHATGDLMSITGDGRVGIGIGATTQKLNTQLTVQSHHEYGGFFTSDSAFGVGVEGDGGTDAGTGVKGLVTNPTSAGLTSGVYGEVTGAYNGTLTNDNVGVYGVARVTNVYENDGVFSYAEGGDYNYGIFSQASSSIDGKTYAVYASGDVVYTGNLIQTSDAKFKENVQSVGPVLDKVMELAPKSYTFRKDPVYRTMDFSSGMQYGVIAQQIEKVFPSLVVNATDPGIDPKNPKAAPHPVHYKGVKYLQMIPILLEAIKEQQEEIKSQQKMIDNLNAEIQSMKK